MAPDDADPGGRSDDLFSQLEAARAELESKEEAVERTVVEGSAAGGAVVIRISGALVPESVRIAPAIVDPSDPGLVEDAVLAALRDALGKLTQLRSSLASGSAPSSPGGLDLGGLDLGGLDLGGLDLGGLLGNLDVEKLLGGVDIGSVMGQLGLGIGSHPAPEGATEGGDEEDPSSSEEGSSEDDKPKA
jgi:DNA-binding protein YbaB